MTDRSRKSLRTAMALGLALTARLAAGADAVAFRHVAVVDPSGDRRGTTGRSS